MQYLRTPLRNMAVLGFVFAMLATSVHASTSGLADSPWPMFHGDARHSGRSRFSGIATTPTVLWKRQVTRPNSTQASHGLSIAADGTIYASLSGGLFALDRADGSVKWSTGDALGYGLSSYSTPAVAADGSLYWGFADSFAHFSATGEILGGQTGLTSNLHFGSDPVIAPDGTVYVMHDALWAFTPEGDIRWVYSFGAFGHSSPALGADGTIYTGAGDGDFYAFTPQGTVKWVQPIGSYSSSPSVGSDGTIYIGTNGSKLYAFNPDGTQKWVFESDESEEYGAATGMYGTPAISGDGTIYIGTHVSGLMAETAHLYAVKPDGMLKWKAPIPRQPSSNPTNPGASSSWMVDQHHNVFGCADNATCYGFDANGNLLWQYLTTPNPEQLEPWLAWNRTTPLLIDDGVMLVVDGTGVMHALADPALAILRANPNALNLALPPGTNTPSEHVVDLTSTDSSIAWTATVEPATPWLSVTAASGTTPDSVRLTIQPAGLAAGVYRAKLRVSTTEQVANPELVIPIQLTIAHQVFLPNLAN